MAVKTAIKDYKNRECLLFCNYERTGKRSSVKYKYEDGIPRSETCYEYKCTKCGNIRRFFD